eukprot:Colp12_sorted_trinity150504_noHs@16818
MRNIDTCTQVFDGHKKTVYCLEVYEDVLYTGSGDGKLRAFDIKTGRLLRTYSGHSNYVTCVAVQRVGDEVIIYTGSNDKTVKVWSALVDKPKRTFKKRHTGHINCLHISADEQIFTGACDNLVVLWNEEKGDWQRTFKGHTDWVRDVKTSNGYLYTASNDCTVCKWGIETGQCLRVFNSIGSRVFCIEVEAGIIYMGTSDKIARAICEESEKEFKVFGGASGHKGPVLSLQTQGDLLVTGSGDKMMKVWNRKSARCMFTFRGHADWVRVVKICGTRIFSGGDDGTVRMWILEDYEEDSAVGSSVNVASTVGDLSSKLEHDQYSVSYASDSSRAASSQRRTNSIQKVWTGIHDTLNARIQELEIVNNERLKMIQSLQQEQARHFRQEMLWEAEKRELQDQISRLQQQLEEVALPRNIDVLRANLRVAKAAIIKMEEDLKTPVTQRSALSDSVSESTTLS